MYIEKRVLVNLFGTHEILLYFKNYISPNHVGQFRSLPLTISLHAINVMFIYISINAVDAKNSIRVYDVALSQHK